MRSIEPVSLCSYSSRKGYNREILTIIIIITHNHLLHLPKLTHLAPKVLIKRIKMHLQLLRIQLRLWIIRWVLVEVWKQDGLGVGGLDVLPGAAVAVAAGTDLVVEGAVDFVLLGAKDGGEVVGHGGQLGAVKRYENDVYMRLQGAR